VRAIAIASCERPLGYVGTIAFDGERSRDPPSRRDRNATIAITCSLSTGVVAGAASRPRRQTGCAIRGSVDEV